MNAAVNAVSAGRTFADPSATPTQRFEAVLQATTALATATGALLGDNGKMLLGSHAIGLSGLNVALSHAQLVGSINALQQNRTDANVNQVIQDAGGLISAVGGVMLNFYGNNPVNLYNGVQQIKFTNGTTWDLSSIVSRASGGSSSRAPLVETNAIGGSGPSDRFAWMQLAKATTAVDPIAGRIGVLGGRKHHHGDGHEPGRASVGDRMRTHDLRPVASFADEPFETSVGRTVLDSKVHGLVSAMAAFSPPASGHHRSPSALNDVLPTLMGTDLRA